MPASFQRQAGRLKSQDGGKIDLGGARETARQFRFRAADAN
jgi:hypothetical protein